MKLTILLLLACITTTATVSAEDCTMCLDGSAVTLPGKELKAENIPVNDCGTLDAAVKFEQAGTDNCDGAQAIGFFCGCPIPEGNCYLCPSRAPVPEAALDIVLMNYTASDFIAASPPDLGVTCESMESYMATVSADDEQCSVLSEELSELCMCSDQADDTAIEPEGDSAARSFHLGGVVFGAVAGALMVFF